MIAKWLGCGARVAPVSDLDRLLRQVEELKQLAVRPDDSWMDNMSNEELRALGKRVRTVADGLSGIQTKLSKQVGGGAPRPPVARPATAGGSLGSIVRRDTAASSFSPPPTASPSQPPARNLFPNQGGAMDLGNPMGRRRVGGAAPPPEVTSQPQAPYRPNFPVPKPGETPPRGRTRRPF
ncbi:MAG: hypothetical protein NVSMB32_06820 [Actinomycetota bacterium]